MPNEVVEEGILRLYKTQPDLEILFELMTDFDEGFQEWRYRHIKLVERTHRQQARHRRLARRGVPQEVAVSSRSSPTCGPSGTSYDLRHHAADHAAAGRLARRHAADAAKCSAT